MTKYGRAYTWPNKRATPITPAFFELGSEGAPHRNAALAQLRVHADHHKTHFAGYQSNARLDNAAELLPLLQTAINNIGDAFADPRLTAPGRPHQLLADGFFSLNAKWIERAVLDYFATRWGFGGPNGEPARRWIREDGVKDWEDSYWGYVLSMGCTEGNLMALRSARDYLKGRELHYEANKDDPAGSLHYEECTASADPAYNPVLLYSKASHYSVRKLAQMLELEARVVEVDKDQAVDLKDLVAKARQVLSERRPLAVLFNYGTTWTGALDNVEAAVPALMVEIQKAGMDWREVPHGRRTCRRRGFWFHVDGALGAGYSTFATRKGGAEALPEFDFRLDIQSLAMSGHKWPGAPWPTGIYMTRNRYMLTNDVPSYVGSLDSTLAGSRSGIAPIFLWDWLARQTDAKRREVADGQLALARQLLTWLKEGVDGLGAWDKNATRAPGSIMVVCKAPPEEIVHKYSLAVVGSQVHIVCMPGVTASVVKGLIREMLATRRDEGAGEAASAMEVEASSGAESGARGGY